MAAKTGLNTPGHLTIGEAIDSLDIAERAGEELILVNFVGGKPRHRVISSALRAEPLEADTYLASGRFLAGKVRGNAGRTGENVASVFALVIDADVKDRLGITTDEVIALDGEQLTRDLADHLAELVRVCKATGLRSNFIVCTGHGHSLWFMIEESDQGDVERARAIYKRLVAAFNHAAGWRIADRAVSDAGTRISRLPGAPNRKGPTPRPTELMHGEPQWWTLDALEKHVAAIEPAVEERPAPVNVEPRRIADGVSAFDLDSSAANEIVDLVRPYWSSGQRHALALGLAGWLKRNGVSRAMTLSIIDGCAGNDDERADRLRAVETTYARSDNEVVGWTTIRELLPPFAVQRIDDLLSEFWRDSQRKPVASAPEIILSGGGRGNAQAPAGTQGARIKVRPMSQVESSPIDWMWPRWLARGKLHLLAGLPGDGKSTIAAAVAALGASDGLRFWPDGAPTPSFQTLFILGEDSPEDTLKPRLELHGLDDDAMNRVLVFDAVQGDDGRDRFFNAEKHAADLDDFLAVQPVGLVVVDPLSTIMTGKDRNAEGDVRDALTTLTKVADRRNVAILGIVHVGKPNGTSRTAAQKILGSTGFAAIARVIWQTTPAENGLMAIGVSKANLSLKPRTLLWSRPEDGPILWHGESDKTIDELMSAERAIRSPRADAEGFLREYLAGGMRPAVEVEQAAKDEGIAAATLRRARQIVGVQSWKEGSANGRWWWKLPDGPPRFAGEAAQSKALTPRDSQVSAFASSDNHAKVLSHAPCEHLPSERERFGDKAAA